MSSRNPLILLNDALQVQAASGSFCASFGLDPTEVVGVELFALGNGEWNVPQLRSLLNAVVSGSAMVEAYEMELKIADQASRCLVVNAHLLDHREDELRLVVAINDVTEARAAVREKDALIREKQVLLQELNHRVANSLQIIASVLMQRVRKVQSEETRMHLRDAHHRVMSVATLQRHLAATATGQVRLRPYFTDLCATIGASMIFDRSELSLTVECDDSVSDADGSVSLGLIVTELVINALKHAFPDDRDDSNRRRGSILVTYHADATGWALSVSDDGVGMRVEGARGAPGLGTGIVKALAAQLSASVVVGAANPGTIVKVAHTNGQVVREAVS